MSDKEEKDMSTVAEKYDLKESLVESLKEVQEMRSGIRPKKDWRQSMTEIRRELKED